MDILVRLTVPNHIYRFYCQASAHVADHTPEDIMTDALFAYASLLSKEISMEREAMLKDKCDD